MTVILWRHLIEVCADGRFISNKETTMPKSSTSYVLHLVSSILILSTSYFLLIFCTDPTKPPNDQPDTTSHNFSWTIDTIGTRNSYLKDVAIINENDIWAVGEIHTEQTDCYDSLGVWQPPYNAVHWDGTKWNLRRLLYKGGFWDINTIFAFSENDIWFEAFLNYNGERFVEKPVPEELIGWSINKVWGTSSQDMYFVGTNGNITHYDGQSWQRLESGTDIDIQDIWGSLNTENNEYEILAVASTTFHIERERFILRVNKNTVSTEPDSGLAVNLSTIWFQANKTYYTAGDGLYIRESKQTTWEKETDQLGYYKSEVRGNHINDVFVVGSFGLVSHYNGNSWKHYTEKELPYFYGSWNALAFQNDYIVVAGDSNGRGLILRGKRN